MANNTTKLDIINRALDVSGSKRLASLDDMSASACKAKLACDNAVAELARMHNWNSLTVPVCLAKDPECPKFKWDHRYKLPADYARMISVRGIDCHYQEDQFDVNCGYVYVKQSCVKWSAYCDKDPECPPPVTTCIQPDKINVAWKTSLNPFLKRKAVNVTWTGTTATLEVPDDFPVLASLSFSQESSEDGCEIVPVVAQVIPSEALEVVSISAVGPVKSVEYPEWPPDEEEVGDTLPISYVSDCKPPHEWDALFARAVSYRIAAELSFQLGTSDADSQNLANMAEQAYREARIADSHETSSAENSNLTRWVRSSRLRRSRGGGRW